MKKNILYIFILLFCYSVIGKTLMTYDDASNVFDKYYTYAQGGKIIDINKLDNELLNKTNSNVHAKYYYHLLTSNGYSINISNIPIENKESGVKSLFKMADSNYAPAAYYLAFMSTTKKGQYFQKITNLSDQMYYEKMISYLKLANRSNMHGNIQLADWLLFQKEALFQGVSAKKFDNNSRQPSNDTLLEIIKNYEIGATEGQSNYSMMRLAEIHFYTNKNYLQSYVWSSSCMLRVKKYLPGFSEYHDVCSYISNSAKKHLKESEIIQGDKKIESIIQSIPNNSQLYDIGWSQKNIRLPFEK